MKCTIKNLSPQTVAIFARVNGRDGRFEIGSGKEMVADHYETRIMKIYNKKGLISITPITNTINGINSVALSSGEKNVSGTNNYVTGTSGDTEENFDGVINGINSVDEENIESTTPKSLQKIKEEVEQYVQDGYIKGEWTEEEVKFLKKNYPKKGRKFCSNSLNRNETSVQKKINSLGLKKKKKKK